MRIAYLSDLHIDFGRIRGDDILMMVKDNSEEFDVLVIAGDIANDADISVDFLKLLSKALPTKTIIFVPGNHEYYMFDMAWADDLFSGLNRLGNVMVLGIHSEFELSYRHIMPNGDSYLFVGGTMWTDFSLYGRDERYMEDAVMKMSDFNHIVDYNNVILTPKRTVDFYNRTTEMMRYMVYERKDNSTVIAVTHHTPHRLSIAGKYAMNALNPAFTSGILDKDHPSYQVWTSLVDLWIHGHTHDCFDYTVSHGDSETRVVCNPRGYQFRNGSFENNEFSFKVVEV